MILFDNAKAQMEHIGIFIFGFVMVAIAVVAVLAQKSIRSKAGVAYMINDTYGGTASNSTVFAANVSTAMVDPAMGLGVMSLLIIACLAIIAGIGVIAYIKSR
jgi:hypothetical protein